MAEQKSRMNDRAYKRQMTRQAWMTVTKSDEEMFRRQVEEEDLFEALYAEQRLLQPVYSFTNLYTIYEESDVLQSCVEAMQNNIDGFGYKLTFLGDDVKEKDSAEAKTQYDKAKNFFDHANHEQSWTTVRKLVREDLEVLGNGALEVLRNVKGEFAMAFHAPFKSIRMSRLTGRAIAVPVTIPRNGKMITIKLKKYFRKYCQVSTTTGRRLRWFKEFGDPRNMDADTGQYTNNPKVPASEIWHFKLPFGGASYGLPRWIGAVLQAMGRRSAHYVNYDLFENQGIPPMAVMVSGGVLTDESLDELEAIVRGLRGVEKWNRIMVLESNVEGVGLEEKGTAKIELKNLAEYRREDQMFDRYLTSTEKDIRHRFRLPPLYVGGAETFTHATARSAQLVAEEQVFIPERTIFDELLNIYVLKNELGVDLWKYVTKGPRIVGAQEISKGVEVFAKVGAFTVNHAIDQANEAFGLDMSKFDKPWANYPLPLVLELVKAGKLKGVEDIAEKVTANTNQLPAPPKQLMLPEVTEKVFKSNMFSDTEKAMYKMLVGIQTAVEEIGRCHTDDVI